MVVLFARDTSSVASGRNQSRRPPQFLCNQRRTTIKMHMGSPHSILRLLQMPSDESLYRATEARACALTRTTEGASISMMINLRLA